MNDRINTRPKSVTTKGLNRTATSSNGLHYTTLIKTQPGAWKPNPEAMWVSDHSSLLGKLYV